MAVASSIFWHAGSACPVGAACFIGCRPHSAGHSARCIDYVQSKKSSTDQKIKSFSQLAALLSTETGSSLPTPTLPAAFQAGFSPVCRHSPKTQTAQTLS